MNHRKTLPQVTKFTPQSSRKETENQLKIVPWNLLVTFYGMIICFGIIYRTFNP